MYIYDLPYRTRSDLVTVLNGPEEPWRELGGIYLGCTYLELSRFWECRFHSGSSPADALLQMWVNRNGTVEELFKYLHAMGLYHAMDIIRDCVPSSYLQFFSIPASGKLSPCSSR